MIDAIIALIRGAADVETARTGLMAKPFEFSEIQANYILDMQLRRLTQLEGQKLRDELDELAGDDQGARVDPRRATTKLRHGHQGRARRGAQDVTPTSAGREITLDAGEIDTLDLIEDEEVVVVLSHKGYVKTVAADAFRRQGRGGAGVRGGNLQRRGLRRAPAHHHRALVPAVLLEPRPGLPACARTRSR